MKFLAFLLSGLLMNLFIQAQSPQIDSLEKVLKTTPPTHHTSRVNIMNALAEQWSKFNPDSALWYASGSYKLGVENDYTKGMAQSKANSGWIHINTSKFADGYEDYLKALELFESLRDVKGIALVYNGLGVTYGMQEKYPEAMGYFLKALAIQEKHGTPSSLASSYIKIGVVHQKTHENGKALENYKKALELAEKAGDKRNAASAYNNIGALYGVMGDYKKALEATIKAKELSEETKSFVSAANAYLNIGMAYSELSQNALAEENLTKALNYFIKLKMPDQIARVHNGLANLYLNQKKYNQSKKYVEQSQAIAKQINNQAILFDNYELLIEIVKQEGNYKLAADYYEKLLALKDTLFDAEKNNSIEQLKASHLLEKKQATIEELKHENGAKTLQRNTLIVVIFISALFMVLLILSFVNSKKKNKVISQRTKELTELNNLKDKFFSLLSHDLRSPLSNILLSLDLFKSDFALPEHEKNFLLDQLKASTSSVLETMDNMLAWGQYQIHQKNNVQKQVNLQALTQRVCRFLQQSASNKAIELNNKINETITITADENQLEFVLRNLISNSLKFSHTNSTVEVWAENTRNATTIYVRDFGTGMSKETYERLFNTDKLVSTKGTSGEIGSGLGLMLSQQFIQENNGVLHVDSALGKGTTFKIQLQAANN